MSPFINAHVDVVAKWSHPLTKLMVGYCHITGKAFHYLHQSATGICHAKVIIGFLMGKSILFLKGRRKKRKEKKADFSAQGRDSKTILKIYTKPSVFQNKIRRFCFFCIFAPQKFVV